MKIPNRSRSSPYLVLSLARIVSEDSQRPRVFLFFGDKSSKDS